MPDAGIGAAGSVKVTEPSGVPSKLNAVTVHVVNVPGELCPST